MEMGMPTGDNPVRRCTFIWTDKNTFATADPEGSPYDFGATPVTSVSHDDVIIPVAIEVMPSDDKGTSAIGELDAVKASLTMLDIHYEQVRGANIVRLDDSTYTIDYVAPPQGLFDVNIWTMYITSLDES
jgi:hypothetical protein